MFTNTKSVLYVVIMLGTTSVALAASADTWALTLVLHRTQRVADEPINRALNGILILAAFRFQNLFSTRETTPGSCNNTLTSKTIAARRAKTAHKRRKTSSVTRHGRRGTSPALPVTR
jgi:hypothetical protein